MTFQEACQAILEDPKANPYAKAYAAAGLSFAGQLNPDFQRTQALYILSNLSHWRAPQTKEVRAALRRIGEVK